MGTWGYNTFQNDAASDWLYGLEDAEDADFLLKPIKMVNGAPGKPDVDDCVESLAAAEVIAGARYEPPRGVPAMAKKWIRRTGFSPNDAKVKAAIRAIDKVRKDSELSNTWKKAGKLAKWLKAVDYLRGHLELSLKTCAPKRTAKVVAPTQTLAEFIIEVAARPSQEKRAELRAKLTELPQPNQPIGAEGLPDLKPLHWVASHGLVEEAKLLSARGAVVGLEVCSNRLPKAFTLKNKNYAMVECLIEARAHLDHPLLATIRNGEIKVAERLAGAGANLRFRSDGEDTLLHFAAMAGATKAIKWLLNQGLDINARNCIGETPLHCAAQKGCLAAVKTLIEHGAKVFVKDDEGKTSLDQAIECKRGSVIRYLRRCGV